MKTINVGLIGAGGNTRTRHIPGFKAIENIELSAVANRSMESSKKIAAELRNREQKNFVVSDVDFVNDKFVFSIKGKRLMTVTANGGIKRKIVQKLLAERLRRLF